MSDDARRAANRLDVIDDLVVNLERAAWKRSRSETKAASVALLAELARLRGELEEARRKSQVDDIAFDSANRGYVDQQQRAEAAEAENTRLTRALAGARDLLDRLRFDRYSSIPTELRDEMRAAIAKLDAALSPPAAPQEAKE